MSTGDFILITTILAVVAVAIITVVLVRRDKWIKAGPCYYRVITAETWSKCAYYLEKRYVRDPKKTWCWVASYHTEWEALNEYERLTKGKEGSRIIASNAPRAVSGAESGRLSLKETANDPT